MTYSTLENNTALGIQGILNFPTLDTPMFYPLFLFSIFIIITSLSLFKEISRQGRGNMMSSLAVAGYVTLALAGILSAMGLISTTVLVTTLVATMIFQVLFLLTKDS